MAGEKINANRIEGFISYFVSNQNTFNELFSQVSAGNYKIKDDIKSIYYVSGTYSISSMLTYFGDISTTITIDKNNAICELREPDVIIDWTGITGSIPYIDNMVQPLDIEIYEDIFIATSGQTEFILSTSPESKESVSVFVNSAYQAKDTFSLVGDILTLSSGCDGGDKVVVKISVTQAPSSSLSGKIITVVADAGSTYGINITNSIVFDITLTEDCTFTFPSTLVSNYLQEFIIYLKQDTTGGWTPSFPSSVKWADDTPPTLDETPSTLNIIRFFSLGDASRWYGEIIGEQYPI